MTKIKAQQIELTESEPRAGQVLTWSGSKWVCSTPPSTPGGIDFFISSDEIIPVSKQNNIAVKKLLTLDEIIGFSNESVVYHPGIFNQKTIGVLEAYRTINSFNMKMKSYDFWEFRTYAFSNSVNVKAKLISIVYKVTDIDGVYINAHDGNTKKVASKSSNFYPGDAASSGFCNCSYIETNTGLYPIREYLGTKSVLIEAPEHYSDQEVEKAKIWRVLFEQRTQDITNAGFANLYVSYNEKVALEFDKDDYIGTIYFAEMEVEDKYHMSGYSYGGSTPTSFRMPIS